MNLKDSFGRVHDYLRISLTDNCNLRCIYCMPEDNYQFTPHKDLMQVDEIYEIAKTFVSMGVTKIRLTGGEPFVRKDAVAIIHRLASLGVSLSVTTNGTRIHKYWDILKQVGLDSINISLDTLNPDQFLLLTRRDEFNLVLNNIIIAVNKGFRVKLNMVVIKDVNDTEILDFIQLTRDLAVEVRFIEFMPFAKNSWKTDKVTTCSEILKIVESRFSITPFERLANETAKRFYIPGHMGSFGIIATMSAHFCNDCNRMRLTADGKLKNCLFSKKETDLLTAYRNMEDIEPLILQNISSKKKELGGQFSSVLEKVHAEKLVNRAMVAIGG